VSLAELHDRPFRASKLQGYLSLQGRLPSVQNCEWQLSNNQYGNMEFRNVPVAVRRGMKYSARKLMVMTSNKVPNTDGQYRVMIGSHFTQTKYIFF